MKNRIVIVLTVLCILQTTILVSASPKNSNVLTEISFPKNEGRIFLPITIFGKEYYFLLDTSMHYNGVGYNVYDSSLQPFLGPAIGKADGGSKAPDFYDSPEAKLGALSLKSKTPVFTADLQKLSLFMGRRIHGMIGMSFLKQHAFKIDFDKGKIVFYNHLKNMDTEGWIANPLSFYKDIPFFKTVVYGANVLFRINTGSTVNGSMHPKLVDYLIPKNKMNLIDKGIALMDDFYFNSFKYYKVMFSVGKSNTLGLGLLSRYSIIFDFPNKIMYLKKRKTFREDILCKVGLSLIRKNDKTVVYGVKKRSPASKAGFKKDDILLSVDGKDSNKFTLYMLRRHLHKPGQVIKLKISRKGKIMKLQLKPEAY